MTTSTSAMPTRALVRKHFMARAIEAGAITDIGQVSLIIFTSSDPAGINPQYG